MKGKLLRDAGEIQQGTPVEIVTKDCGEADGSTRDSPVYSVTDGAGHEEHVDTRDLELLP